MKPFIWGIILTSIFWSWTMQKYYTFWAVETNAPTISQVPRGGDFGIYYGHVTGTATPQQEYDYLYPSHTKIELAWFSWFPKQTAYEIWTTLMLASYLILMHKLIKVQDGWIIALITLKPFLLVIVSGNIAAALPLLCVWPWGMVVASSFKCYCAGFLFLFALSGALCARRAASADRQRHSDLPRAGMGDS